MTRNEFEQIAVTWYVRARFIAPPGTTIASVEYWMTRWDYWCRPDAEDETHRERLAFWLQRSGRK